MSAGLEGELAIHVSATATHRVAKDAGPVSIRSTRPVRAAEVLAGRPLASVDHLLPRLFALCGQAQWVAGMLAARAAQGEATPEPLARAWGTLVLVETAREHALRALMDLPRLSGEPVGPALRSVAHWVPRVSLALNPRDPGDSDLAGLVEVIDDIEATLAGPVFGVASGGLERLTQAADLADWRRCARGPAGTWAEAIIARGWASAGQCSAPALSETDDGAIVQRLAGSGAARFVAEPELPGSVPGGHAATTPGRESTPLARWRVHPLVQEALSEAGDGLLSRVIARWLELASIPQRLRILWALAATDMWWPTGGPGALVHRQLSPGEGYAAVEAARGRLIHRVCLDGPTVTRYQILAPTEWNFHPRGVAACALGRLTETSARARREQAEWLIHSVDPCVGFRLTLD